MHLYTGLKRVRLTATQPGRKGRAQATAAQGTAVQRAKKPRGGRQRRSSSHDSQLTLTLGNNTHRDDKRQQPLGCAVPDRFR
jgi:hypothetical protein